MPPLSLPPFTINFSPYHTVVDSIEGLADKARSLPLCPESISAYQSFVRLSNRYQHKLSRLNDRTTVLFHAAPGISPAHLTPRGLALVDVRLLHDIQALTEQLRDEVLEVVEQADRETEGLDADDALELIEAAVLEGGKLGESAMSAALLAGAEDEEVLLIGNGDNELFYDLISQHSHTSPAELALPARTG